jgi:predicted nucleic acid-binding Zn ribbon protein
MRRRAPRSVAGAVQALADRLAPATTLSQVQRVWEDAVGPAVAAEAAPVGEREGELTIACSAAVWAQELDLMGPELVAKINAAMGAEAVRSVRCVTRAQ